MTSQIQIQMVYWAGQEGHRFYQCIKVSLSNRQSINTKETTTMVIFCSKSYNLVKPRILEILYRRHHASY